MSMAWIDDLANTELKMNETNIIFREALDIIIIS